MISGRRRRPADGTFGEKAVRLRRISMESPGGIRPIFMTLNGSRLCIEIPKFLFFGALFWSACNIWYYHRFGRHRAMDCR
jgi:hypothetical protein